MEGVEERALSWSWVGAILLAQTGWGAYPVLARYLQTISGLPSMSVIGLANLLALVILLFFLRSKIDRDILRSRHLLVFALIVIGRGITNFLAARYTLAIYVQLITQLTPFLVAVLSLVVLHERLPAYTGRALAICLAGAGMIVGADLIGAGSLPAQNRTDWLGAGLATASSLLLALYMIAVRRTTRQHIGGETLLLVQLFALGAVTTLLSLFLGESWSAWLHLTARDWLIFGTFTIGVFVGANALQIGAIRHLGASLVSSTMAWRLVSALFLGAILLGERLTSLVQLAGAAVVLVTISWYLWQQRGGPRRSLT